jgi:hypothetical protein
MNILLGAILVLNIAVIVAVALIYRKISRVFAQFITPVSDSQPSPLAMLIDNIATMFSRSIVMQAKASFMGIQSGQKRAETAIAGDIAEGMVSQSPLGGLLNSFPALKKTLRRNPQLIDMAMQFMSKQDNQTPSGNQTVSAGGNGHSQVKFKL